MAGSADSVGRLIATTALREGERQLLRGAAGEPRDAAKQPAPSRPFSHQDVSPGNARATAAVLLTLLDEQIDAAERAPARQAEKADANGARSDTSSDRLHAKFAHDGFPMPALRDSGGADAHNINAAMMAAAPGRAELLAQLHRVGVPAPPTDGDSGAISIKRKGAAGFFFSDGHAERRPHVAIFAALLAVAAAIMLLI